MAEFPAVIGLKVESSQVERAIGRVEQRLDRLRKLAEEVRVGGGSAGGSQKLLPPATETAFQRLNKNTKDLQKRLEKLGSVGAFAGFTALGEAVNVLGRNLEGATIQIQRFGQTFEFANAPAQQLGAALHQLTAPLDGIVNLMQSLTPATQAGAVAVGALSAAYLAFKPQIDGVVTNIKGFTKNLADQVLGTEQAVRTTREYRAALYPVTDTLKNLANRERAAQKALNATNSTSEAAAQIRTTLVSITKRLNDEQERQNVLLAQATREQRVFNDQARVTTNLARSAASRAGTGFTAFSQRADEIIPGLDQTAIDKSIRRQREKIAKAFRDMPAMQAPLMLPSSEMLNASGRGIKQLSSYYGDLSTKIDEGVQKGRAFTDQLNAQAAKAQTLPPIFTQFETAIKNTAAAIKPAEQIQQSWAQALQQGAMWSKQNVALDKEALALADKEVLAEREITFEKRLQARLDKNALEATKKRAALRKSIGGRVSSAAIGGAFPLLFGQSGLAAAGGALGGLLGGAGGGFAGSLVGSLIGDIINTRQQIEELGKEMGLGAEDAKLLGEAFRQAGADADKFQASVQNIRGVGFASEDQLNVIRLASKLTEDYGGKVDKVSQAYANIATSGRAGLSDVFKFTAQGIPVLQQLEKNLGLNRSQLLKFIKDGKLTAQQLSDALVQIANKSREEAAKTYTPWDKAWKDIGATTSRVLKFIKTLLKPFVDDVARVATRIAQIFAELYKYLVDGAIKAAQGIANALAGIADNFAGVLRGIGSSPITGVLLGGGAGEGFLQDAERATAIAAKLRKGANDLQTALEPAAPPQIGGITLPGLQDTTKGGGGKDKRATDYTSEVALARELLDIERRLGEAKLNGVASTQAALEIEKLLLQQKAQIAKINASDATAAQKADQIAKTQLETDRQLLENSYQRQIANQQLADSWDEIILDKQNEIRLAQTSDGLAKELLKAEIFINEQRLKGVVLTDAQVEAYKKLVEEAYKLTAPLDHNQKILEEVVNGAGTQLAGLFDTLIQGTEDWNKVLTNTLRTFSSFLLKAGLSALGGDDGKGFFSIFSGNFGKRADGGPVSANRPYLVGEEGPEMFVPGKSGTIIPNGAGGGVNSVVNVTINGDGTSNVDSSQGAELGRLINSSVTAILMRERRPGGMLAR